MNAATRERKAKRSSVRSLAENASCGAKRSATLAKLGVFEWPQVDRELLAIGDDVRADVVRRFRRLGGSFSKWSSRDAALVVEAIVHVEDSLELASAGRMTKARLALRVIRRRVEGVVWP